MLPALCPDRQILSDCLLGKLPDEDSEVVLRHVEECPPCQATVQNLAGGDTLVDQLQAPPAADGFETEEDCRRVVGRIRGMACATSTGGGAAGEATADDLGSVREYRLLAKLGQGGMGTVFKALHTKLDKVVALKVLPPQRLGDAQAVARFEREMKAVGKLDHPHLVHAHDAGEHAGTHYLVMEHVPGLDVGQVVYRLGSLPIADACEVVRQAALGLQYAHEAGLVHRDVKPSNLMLTPEGTVKILDLGLALLAGAAAEGAAELTSTSQVMGTLDYMAPEQGDDTHSVDNRADLYALGATLFKLLTGSAPFSGREYRTPMQKMMALANTPAPSVRQRRPDVSPVLAALVQRLLSKKPEERPDNSAELAELLAPFAQGSDLRRLMTRALALGDGERSRASTMRQLGAVTSPAQAVGTAIAAPSVPKPAGARRKVLAALAAGLAAIFLLGVVLLNLRTADGQVIIELADGVPAEDFQVSVKKDGKEIAVADAEKGWTLRIVEGRYEIEIQGGKDQVQLDRDRVTVTRGGVERLRITRKELAKGKALPPIRTGPPLSELALVRAPAVLPGVKSWTIETVQPRIALGTPRGLAISPDSKTLAVGGDDCIVRLYELTSGKLQRVIVPEVPARNPAANRILALDFSPDGKTLACGVFGGSSGGAAFLYGLTSGVVHQIGLDGGLLDLAWSPDGKHLALRSKSLLLWHAESRKLLPPLPLSGPFCWAPDGKELAVVKGNRIQIFDLSSRKVVRSLEGNPGGTKYVAWSPDGNRLASAGWNDKAIRFWNARTGKPELVVGGQPKAGEKETWRYDSEAGMAWAPGSKLLAVGGQQPAFSWSLQDIALLDPDSGFKRSLWQGSQSFTMSVAWSPDGNYLAAASLFGGFHVFESTKFKEIYRVGIGRHGAASFWSPDGERLLQGYSHYGNDWQLKDGLVRGKKLPGFASLAWTSDGRTVAVCGRQVSILGSSSLKTIATLEAKQAIAVALSPDGKKAATASSNSSQIRIWDTISGLEEKVLAGHTNEVSALSWAEDGKTLASGSRDGKVRFWEAQAWTGKETDEPLGFPVDSLVWSPDGKAIAAAPSSAGKIRVWRLADGMTLRRIERPGTWLGPVVWSRDGKRLFFGVTDGKFFETSLDALEEKVLFAAPCFRPQGSQFSKDGRWLATSSGSAASLWNVKTGEPAGVLLSLDDKSWLSLSPEGHYRGTPGIEKSIVYVVQTERGQETMTPEVFAERFGWKNDPERVRLPVE